MLHSRSLPEFEPIWAHGHVIGHFESGSGTFEKLMRLEHYLRKPPAIAIDALTYRTLRPKLRVIVAIDATSGLRRHLDAEEFDRFVVAIERGFGPQLMVPLPYWHTDFDASGGAPADGPKQPPVTQLAMPLLTSVERLPDSERRPAS